MSKLNERRAQMLNTRLTETMRMSTGRLKNTYNQVTDQSVTAHNTGAITVDFTYSDGTESAIDFEPGKNAYEMAREARRHAAWHSSGIQEARRIEREASNRTEDRERERAARAKAFEARIAEIKPGATLTGDDADDALEYLQETIEARGGDVVLQAMTAKPGDVVTFAPGDGAEYGHTEVVTEESAAAYNAESAALKARIAEALLTHRPADRTIEEVDGRHGAHMKCAGCDFGSFSPYREDQVVVAAFLEKARTADFPVDDLDRAFADHQADVVARLL